jgi:hypothetical protein
MLNAPRVVSVTRSATLARLQESATEGRAALKRGKEASNDQKVAIAELESGRRRTLALMLRWLGAAALGKAWQDAGAAMLRSAGWMALVLNEPYDIRATKPGRRGIKLEVKARRRGARADILFSGIRPKSMTHILLLLTEPDGSLEQRPYVWMTRRQYEALGWGRLRKDGTEQVSISRKRRAKLEEDGLALTAGELAATINRL